MILLTRKAEFSASHYYWSEQLSPAENVRLFGKCANRNGHGHNYTLEVTVEGEIDPVSGFVVDLKQLKDVIHRQVVDVYDHRHLNLEIPEFKRLENQIEGAKLHRIRVYEMPDLFSDYYGEA
jgi:6-pyruvoyltetrahydropterin/6-carboxytetrahydropterin synthase